MELKKNTESYLGVSGWFPTISFPDLKRYLQALSETEKEITMTSVPFFFVSVQEERACQDLEQREAMWKTNSFLLDCGSQGLVEYTRK